MLCVCIGQCLVLPFIMRVHVYRHTVNLRNIPLKCIPTQSPFAHHFVFKMKDTYGLWCTCRVATCLKKRDSLNFGVLCSHAGKWNWESCPNFLEDNYGNLMYMTLLFFLLHKPTSCPSKITGSQSGPQGGIKEESALLQRTQPLPFREKDHAAMCLPSSKKGEMLAMISSAEELKPGLWGKKIQCKLRFIQFCMNLSLHCIFKTLLSWTNSSLGNRFSAGKWWRESFLPTSTL